MNISYVMKTQLQAGSCGGLTVSAASETKKMRMELIKIKIA